MEKVEDLRVAFLMATAACCFLAVASEHPLHATQRCPGRVVAVKKTT